MIVCACLDLLLDYADALQVNVFTLGATYLKLCQRLKIKLPIVGKYRLRLWGICRCVERVAVLFCVVLPVFE